MEDMEDESTTERDFDTEAWTRTRSQGSDVMTSTQPRALASRLLSLDVDRNVHDWAAGTRPYRTLLTSSPSPLLDLKLLMTH